MSNRNSVSVPAYPRSYKSGTSSGMLDSQNVPIMPRRNSLKHFSWPFSFKDTTSTRSKLVRQDTDQLLSYYQSPLADQGRSYASTPDKLPLHSRQISGGSTSPSDYSSESETNEPATNDVISDASSRTTRRLSAPSQGGSDRRRLAIVQMETVNEHSPFQSRAASENGHGGPSRTNTLRTRRGLESSLAGLALVAPPDASPDTYAHLTPPSTAPITADDRTRGMTSRSDSHGEKGHSRSASEAANPKKAAPRDIGIVGTSHRSSALEVVKPPQIYADNKALRPPIFQRPQSRSPSPGGRSDVSEHSSHIRSPADGQPLLKRRSSNEYVITPEIGEGKDIDVLVASPVVTSLGSSSPPQVASTPRANPVPQIVVRPIQSVSFPPKEISSYLHYKPGKFGITLRRVDTLINCYRRPCYRWPITSSSKSRIRH